MSSSLGVFSQRELLIVNRRSNSARVQTEDQQTAEAGGRPEVLGQVSEARDAFRHGQVKLAVREIQATRSLPQRKII